MYKKILVALENSQTDQSLIPHILELAKIHQSKLLLVHVADGFTARHYNELSLKQSEEMIQDQKYLDEVTRTFSTQGLSATSILAMGEPAEEILRIAAKEGCDLIAMTSHGHRFLADIILGSTIEEVRHSSSIPILVVKGLYK